MLVYSKLGISRSAAVAIAYLMYDRKCKLKASIASVSVVEMGMSAPPHATQV